MATTGFIHLDYFWLRNPGSSEDARLLAEGAKLHLSTVPDVLRIEVGYPAGTQREIVDNSYGVGLLIEFADAAAHDRYQVHAGHLSFIEACSQYWSRVQIYDTLIGVV